MDYSISSDEINKKMNGNIKIISYDELKNYNINDLLIYGACIILYQHRKDYGHWVCIYTNNKNNNIFFFDSFGNEPDNKDLKYNNKYNKEKKELIKKLYKTGYNIHYNNYKLQNEKYKTCGKWCILRLKYKNICPCKFFKILKEYKNKYNYKNYDDIILKYYDYL